MKPFFILRVLAPVTIAVIAGSGCGSAKEAITFNDNVTNAHKRIADAGNALGKALATNNIEQARSVLKTANATLAEIKADTQTWKVPESESAKAFLESHHRLLKIEEDEINNFAAIVKVLEDKSLNEQQRNAKIDSMMQDDTKERAAIADLQAKQITFAKAHNIKLMPK